MVGKTAFLFFIQKTESTIFYRITVFLQNTMQGGSDLYSKKNPGSRRLLQYTLIVRPASSGREQTPQ